MYTTVLKQFAAAALVLSLAMSASFAAGMDFFHGTWDEAVEEAQKEGKFIFVDCYTTWCGPCKKMAKQVFPRDEVGAFMNKNFINVKVDMEKGEGPTLKGKWGVSAYPTMIFFNSAGEEVHRFKGARKVADFLTEARKGIMDVNQLAEFDEKYEGGERNPAFLYKYANMLKMAGSNRAEMILDEYMNTQSGEEKFTRDNMDLILDFADDLNSNSFKVLQDNKDKFVEVYSAEKINGLIQQTAYGSLQKAIDAKDANLMKTIKSAVKSADPDKGEEKNYQLDIAYYKGIEDWNNYAKTAVKYLKKYESKNASYLNNLAWDFFQHVDNAKMLKKAEQWAKLSTEIDDQHFNNDTYANLLFKNGKDAEAILVAEKAITIAKYEKRDFSATQKLLDEILTN